MTLAQVSHLIKCVRGRAALAHKATGFSAKLLRRTDQCRALLVSANLHWQTLDPEPPTAPQSPPQARLACLCFPAHSNPNPSLDSCP